MNDHTTAAEVDADTVASRAAQVITTMGAEIRALRQERNRYRNAWHNARARAVDARSDVEFTEQQPAVVPSADRAALRDRIRRALCEADGKGFMWDSDMLEPDEYGDVADMVLSVLPATAEEHRLALCDALRLGSDAPWDAIHDRVTELGLPPIDQDPVARRLGLLPAPADRAAVRSAALQEGADAVAGDTGFHIRYGAVVDYAEHYAALLRRLAGEAAPDNTETPTARPVRHEPGKAVLCSDCHAKGHAACMADREADHG